MMVRVGKGKFLTKTRSDSYFETKWKEIWGLEEDLGAVDLKCHEKEFAVQRKYFPHFSK
jgi:hypothetical protein